MFIVGWVCLAKCYRNLSEAKQVLFINTGSGPTTASFCHHKDPQTIVSAEEKLGTTANVVHTWQPVYTLYSDISHVFFGCSISSLFTWCCLQGCKLQLIISLHIFMSHIYFWVLFILLVTYNFRFGNAWFWLFPCPLALNKGYWENDSLALAC